LRQEHTKRIWDLLILKILDSRPGGEAPTSKIAKELALLDYTTRETLPSHSIEGGVFGAGFVTSPRKGVWRISEAGRKYIKSGMPKEMLKARRPAVVDPASHHGEAPVEIPDRD
jgi:hypothetical protein